MCVSSKNDNYEWQNMEIIIAILGIDVNLSLVFSKLIQVLYKWEMSQMQNWYSVKWCYVDNFIF